MHACKEEKYEKVVRNVLMNRRKNFVNGYIALSAKLVQMFMVRKIGKMIHSRDENKKNKSSKYSTTYDQAQVSFCVYLHFTFFSIFVLSSF